MAYPIAQPVTQYVGLDGEPLDSGYIYIGTANANPKTNPIDVFFDIDETITAAQPIRTVAGYPKRAGAPAQIFVDAVTYSITVEDSDGVTVFTLPSVATALVATSAFGADLIASADATEAQQLMGVEVGVDVQPYDVDTPTVKATEVQMRTGTSQTVLSMTPELVGFAIDELGTSVRVTDDDTTAGRLEDKIGAGDGITITVLNPGANETLEIAASTTTRLAYQTAGGKTNITFEIPNGVIGFTISYSDLSDMTNQTTLRLGTSAGIVSSGYDGMRVDLSGQTDYHRAWSSTCFPLGGNGWTGDPDISSRHGGSITFTRISTNIWTMSGSTGETGGSLTTYAGNITLGDTLTDVEIETSVAFVSGGVGVQYW